jgi:hypothetical protein
LGGGALEVWRREKIGSALEIGEEKKFGGSQENLGRKREKNNRGVREANGGRTSNGVVYGGRAKQLGGCAKQLSLGLCTVTGLKVDWVGLYNGLRGVQIGSLCMLHKQSLCRITGPETRDMIRSKDV